MATHFSRWSISLRIGTALGAAVLGLMACGGHTESKGSAGACAEWGRTLANEDGTCSPGTCSTGPYGQGLPGVASGPVDCCLPEACVEHADGGAPPDATPDSHALADAGALGDAASDG